MHHDLFLSLRFFDSRNNFPDTKYKFVKVFVGVLFQSSSNKKPWIRRFLSY